MTVKSTDLKRKTPRTAAMTMSVDAASVADVITHLAATNTMYNSSHNPPQAHEALPGAEGQVQSRTGKKLGAISYKRAHGP